MRWPLVLVAITLVACGASTDATAPGTDAADDSPPDAASDSAGDVAVDSVEALDVVVADSATEDASIDTSTTADTTPDVPIDAPPSGAGWTALPAAPSGFAPRRSHIAAWTGGSMIVWGGCGAAEKPIHGDGAAYDPTTNTWKVIRDAGLAPRYLHAAAWSGSELLVIGGITGSGGFGYTTAKDGALYNPATDSWSSPITLPGDGRYAATAVWSTTTNEFLVWGGFNGSVNLGDGYAYKPATKTWRTMSAVGAPAARNAHAAAWNGTRMLLLGGSTGGPYYAADAFAYDPVADKWETLTPPSTYVGRNGTTPGSVHEGRVAFWGGRASWKTTDLRGDGLLFEGVAPSEIPEPSASLLPNPKRENAVAWWSGERLFVWGGRASEGWVAVGTGASFDRATKSWSAMATTKAPSARYGATAVVNPVTGRAYVWGGYNDAIAFADGASFSP